jgi:hypothetical protein
MDPISLFASPFCQGDRADVRRFRAPMGCEAPNEGVAIGAVTIPNDIARRFTPTAGLGQLMVSFQEFGAQIYLTRKRIRWTSCPIWFRG